MGEKAAAARSMPVAAMSFSARLLRMSLLTSRNWLTSSRKLSVVPAEPAADWAQALLQAAAVDKNTGSARCIQESRSCPMV